MYREDFKKVSEIGKAKTGWLKENPIGYFVAAMAAG
ncbi:formate/nitrite family of transporter [Roseburia sp. CAG:182]|nr:formate/nitrite family of transporter [Roseburia sp. CAG:182]